MHSQVLAQRITAARDAVTVPALKADLSDEVSLVTEYVIANDELAKAAARNPGKTLAADLNFELNQKLQSKIEDNSSELEASAKQADRTPSSKAGAAPASFSGCWARPSY